VDDIVKALQLVFPIDKPIAKNSPGAMPLVLGINSQAAKLTQKADGSDFEHDTDSWAFGTKEVAGATYGRFTDAVEVTFTAAG